ncbi:signal transducer and activator of transcription 1-alpha/beta-like isoform X2 [Mya arenaria]|uniref:signal transducer and activator of transcription 1-alpha/beta-like isoform X2 n=1 Tax=Mya arenaria TaxID=6604 RepID=UPI0022E73FD1|nr:signal transducer and activator of transcription 1-alpha/beta-like isoform X2 [Mya arenaria]XP_052790417.1 signal transducer and activator of transcription 1-alpha/beta-like isoform X2 [Mya arenaria]
MASPLETDVWGTNGKTGENPVGMIAFMQKLQDPDLTYLSTEWDKLLKELEVDIFLRNDMDSWFQKCFKLYTCAKSRFQANKEKLSDEFVTEMKRKLELSRPGETANDNKGAVTNYLQRLRAFDQLKQKINDGTVVEMAVICIRREQDLIMALCPSERQDEVLLHLTKAKELKECLAKTIHNLEKGLQHVGDIDEEQDVQIALQITLENIEPIRQECGRLLGSIQEILPELTRTLNNQIEEWKQQFQLQYAELYADANVEPIAKRSSEIWGFLQELRAIVIEQLSRLVNENSISEIKQAIARTVIDLIKKTFLVTDQSIYVLKQGKLGKKNTPDSLFTVRILAAEMTDLLKSMEVKAYLLYDEDLNDCWNGRELNMEIVMGRRKDVNGKPSVRFTKEPKGRFKATFNSLTVDKIKRPKSGKQVHEEKYRFVFVTKFEETLLLTVSLPLVIVTATNQQCHAMASIMWECFSTNVFQLPVCVPVELPWSTIAEMLNAKIRRLCPTRALTDDNIKHLKHRLIGCDESDETLVSLQKFCFVSMDRLPQVKSEFDAKCSEPSRDQSFSFWQWFMACYNLIDKHLMNYWERGWIYGFISKDEATRKLKALKLPEAKNGLFLLRFSDNSIVESQGVGQMFGYLRSTKMIVRCNEGNKPKRGVYNLHVAGPKDLEKDDLANILKQSANTDSSGKMEEHYKWLFPLMRKREDTFDEHLIPDKENSSFDGKTQNWKVTIDLPERDTPFLGKQPCPPDEDSKSLVFPFGTHEYQANTAKYPKLSIPSSLPPLIRFETISSALGNSPVPGSQCQSQQHIPRLPTLSKPFHMSNQNQNNMTSHQSSQAHAQGIRMLGPSVDTLHLDNKMTQAFSEEKPGPPIHQTETPFEHTPISLTEKTLYANIQEKQSESADAGSPMLVDESPVTSGVDTAEGFDRQMQSIASALFRLSVEKRTKVMQYVKTRDNTLLTSGQHSAVGNTVETAATGASFMSVQYANVSSCPDVQNTVTSTAVTGTNDSGNSTSEPEISSGELERANNSGNILPEFWDQQQITDI